MGDKKVKNKPEFADIEPECKKLKMDKVDFSGYIFYLSGRKYSWKPECLGR